MVVSFFGGNGVLGMLEYRELQRASTKIEIKPDLACIVYILYCSIHSLVYISKPTRLFKDTDLKMLC